MFQSLSIVEIQKVFTKPESVKKAKLVRFIRSGSCIAFRDTLRFNISLGFILGAVGHAGEQSRLGL